MRIRKNAKILNEEKNSYLVCKLNRSPWDDDSFFSQLVEEGWDNCLPLNGSLANSNLVSNSNASGDSMELSFDNHVASPPLMIKLDKKCKGEIEKVCNEQVCDQQQRLPLVTPPPPPQPKKRGRPKKSTQAAAGVGNGCGGGGRNNNNSNSYSFYYYSGFGPSWSKKRDTNGNDNNKNNRNVTKRRKKKVYNAKKNYNDNGNDNDNDNRIEEGNDNNKKSKNSGVETVYDEQLDYIDDDFDDDDNDDDGGNGVLYGGVRARPRKPIKARSLKSLM